MKIFNIAGILVLTMLLATACSDSDDSSTSPENNPGTLRVLITDAPATFDAVNVTISEVSVHYGVEDDSSNGSGSDSSDDNGNGIDNSNSDNGQGGTAKAALDSGWITLSNEAQEFDLLTLTNGATALLGEKELESGLYTQMRLEVSDAELIIDDDSYPVKIPSGTIKLIRGFEINDGVTTELVVDFDASRSIHEKGGKGDYQLQPTIRLVTRNDCGSISGTVTNAEHAPLAHAIAGADTINSAYIDTVDGTFTLAFLPTGTYTVAVSDTLGNSYENAAVTVTKGDDTVLGDITLK